VEEDIDRILPEHSSRSTLLRSRLHLTGQTPFLKEIQPQDDATWRLMSRHWPSSSMESRRVLLGDNDLHRILGVLVGECRSLRLLEIHNGDAVAHGRRTLFHRVAFSHPPRYGAPRSFLPCNSCLSHSLSLSLSGKPITMGFCRAL